MERTARTFSHEQLSRWLNEGLDMAKIGFAVFDENGNNLYSNAHCDGVGNCPLHKKEAPSGDLFDETGHRENIIQMGKQEWTKNIRRVFPDRTSICTCMNLSDLNLAEFASSENERKYRLLADNTLDVIWLMDMELNFRYVNPSVEQMLGFSSDEWIGTNLSEHCTSVEMQRMNKIILQAMERGEKKPWVLFETELLSKKKTAVPVEILAKFAFDKNDNMVGIQGTTRDIRERKASEAREEELEALLIQSQKSEALGTLAGGIAHDFNNILHAMIGFSEMSLERIPQDSPIWSNINQILMAGIRAKELVRQILTFVRQKELEVQPIRVNWIAKEALKLLRASLPKTITIQSNISQDACVLADPVQIHQVLMNLCTNASQAMGEERGILGVQISRVRFGKRDWERPQALHQGDYVKIAISDTGSGMTDSQIAEIFKPYFTTKSPGQGTGIGLSVVKSIINKLNGSIEVNSTLNKGTVFNVFLPAMENIPETPAVSEKMLVGGNEHILLIDDEPSSAALGEQILRSMGYDVTAFEESREARNWFARHPHDIDLVISDVTMPEITGDALSRYIREIEPEMPVILCTGYSDKISHETAQALSINAFLRKPIARADLIWAVRSVLDGERLI
ncbi:MAG: response regulator [Desulfobacteraceae bacterium]|jgi:PAS domain S-box-containing protein